MNVIVHLVLKVAVEIDRGIRQNLAGSGRKGVPKHSSGFRRVSLPGSWFPVDNKNLLARIVLLYMICRGHPYDAGTEYDHVLRLQN